MQSAFRMWFSRLVYPLSMVGFGAVCIGVMDAGLSPPLVTGALGLPIVIWVAALERIHPYRREWNRPQDDLRTDFLHLVFSTTAVQQVMAMVLLSFAMWLQSAVGYSRAALWPTAWPLAAQLAFAFVVTELLLYAVHRAEHEQARLWSLHAVHHSATRLYWMNATRFHPLDEVLLATAGLTPLVLLGCPAEVTALAATLAGVNGAFKHANIDVELGPLNYIVSMAELHRVHHAPDAETANCNYGGNLMLFDLVFGTFRLATRHDDPVDVGLGESSPPVPPNYTSQLAYPFIQWSRVRAASTPHPERVVVGAEST